MIIYKILDPRQYKLSPGYKNIDIDEVIKNHKTLDFYDINYFDFFASADKIETDLNFDKKATYIIPFFYNHAEQLDTLDIWKKNFIKFVEEYKEIFQYATLAICDPFESSQHFIDTVEEVKQIQDILVISANKKYSSCVYTDSWIHRFQPLDKPINFDNERLYINLNRVARYHRCLLLDKLIENDLHTLGFNTWGDVYGKFNEYKISNNSQIDKYIWDSLDIDDLSSVNPNNTVPIYYCKNSFLFLSTETHVDNQGLFFSEKVYKPIGLGMPFITLGNPGTIADLKSRGYKTFDNWWNEDYDNDLSLDDRIKIIIDNLKYLSKQDLQDIRKQTYEVCYHNLELYKKEKIVNKLRENLNALFDNS